MSLRLRARAVREVELSFIKMGKQVSERKSLLLRSY